MAIKNFNIPSPQDPLSKKVYTVPLPAAPTPEKTINIVTNAKVDDRKSQIIAGNAQGNETDKALRKSKLGTPVYSEVVIKKDSNVIASSDSFSNNDFIRFDTCILTVTQQRNIIKTPIQGRNGTVKEYISDGDYQINIKGSIFGDAPDKMPQKILKDSHTLFIEPNELWIESDFIQSFGIQYCVIENYTIDQVEGSRSRVDFNISLVSDEPVEVKLGIKENA